MTHAYFVSAPPTRSINILMAERFSGRLCGRDGGGMQRYVFRSCTEVEHDLLCNLLAFCTFPQIVPQARPIHRPSV